MDTEFIKDLFRSAIREFIHYRMWVAGTFIAISFFILMLGLVVSESYQTSTLLYADESNIIQPLLKGRAEVTKIDRSQKAREVIYTRKILLDAAKKGNLLNESADVEAEEAALALLRYNLKVQAAGKNYFRISYKHSKADSSFEALNAVVSVFIEDAARRKREESYGAFKFIEAQVKTYKGQLEQAEEKLKQFKSGNLDGTEASVTSRIAGLRAEVEEIKLGIDEQLVRKRLIKEQLSKEGKYQKDRGKVDFYRERISQLNTELDSLLLNYQESYPDVVFVKLKITELQAAMNDIGGQGEMVSNNSSNIENPLYEELRKQLSAAEVDLSSMQRRLIYLKRLQKEGYARSARVAGNQAELTDLTRDYQVTKKVYEEMLERQESARLSMTLDIEGQGVSYKIQEPAVFPLKPSGIRFYHFALVGPLLALILPFGLVIAYVVLDPRVRSATLLASQLPGNVDILGVIPHANTPMVRRLQQTDVIMLGLVSAGSAVLYCAIVIVKIVGII